jgi:hypothetical protein
MSHSRLKAMWNLAKREPKQRETKLTEEASNSKKLIKPPHHEIQNEQIQNRSDLVIINMNVVMIPTHD